ncbi:hypothetical protein ABIF64_001644 [Bradyrhizobium japonicum]
MKRLADIHGRARRRLVRQQHRDALAQRLRGKRRGQWWQHREAIFLADLLHGPDDDGLAGADGENLAVEGLAHQRLQKRAGLDAVGGDAEQDQVRQLASQHGLQLVRAGAFAGDETKILQHLGEECAQMALAVGDACARRYLSPSEGFGPPSGEFNKFIVHRKPLPFRDRC